MDEKSTYVYAYLDPRKAGTYKSHIVTFLYEPIYLGKGKGGRLTKHLIRKDNHPLTNKIKKIRCIGVEPIVLKVFFGEEIECLKMECLLISEFGRLGNGGTLCNITEGGEGVSNPSAETRIKIGNANRGRLKTKEVKAKMKQSHLDLNWHPTDEQRRKQSLAQTGRKLSEATKAKIKARNEGKQNTPEQRSRQSLAQTGRTLSTQCKEKLSQRFSGSLNPAAKKWLVIDPLGFKRVICSLKTFCDENGLSWLSMRNSNKSGKAICKGSSRGWSCKELL